MDYIIPVPFGDGARRFRHKAYLYGVLPFGIVSTPSQMNYLGLARDYLNEASPSSPRFSIRLSAGKLRYFTVSCSTAELRPNEPC